MNSPYMGKFKVTQQYKSTHDGLDLVGLDSKEIHSTINGKVVYAGWENSKNKKQGFGQYVKIKQDGTNNYYYFGHLSSINVKVGQTVKITQIIGKEGSTGYSTGSHCHYCVRKNGVKGNDLNISSISGIPNKLGIYDDGYRESNKSSIKTPTVSNKVYKKICNCSSLNLRTSASYSNNIYKSVKCGTKVEYLGMSKGWAKISYNGKILYCGPRYLK